MLTPFCEGYAITVVERVVTTGRFVMRLHYNGIPTERHLSRYTCLEHAEAEACSLWPSAGVVNDMPVTADIDIKAALAEENEADEPGDFFDELE